MFLTISLAGTVLLGALVWMAVRYGRSKQKAKAHEEMERELEDVRKIHNKIDSDPDFRERVRRMFDGQ